MKREPRWSEYLGITDCKVIITWSDGVVEDIGADLPESLGEELECYLDELDELRNIEGGEYNFSEENE